METVKECDGHNVYESDIYQMNPTLVPVNGDIVGMNCANLFSGSMYARSYLGSDWVPPNGASPNWQNLVPAMTGSTVQLVSEGGKSFYACDFALNSLPSNIVLDFGAQGGSSLAQKIVPTLVGDRLPEALEVDPTDYLSRVHMVVRPVRQAQFVLDEEGLPIIGRSEIGSPGPQNGTLAADCPSYALATNGGVVGTCTNLGHYESPCGDCY